MRPAHLTIYSGFAWFRPARYKYGFRWSVACAFLNPQHQGRPWYDARAFQETHPAALTPCSSGVHIRAVQIRPLDLAVYFGSVNVRKNEICVNWWTRRGPCRSDCCNFRWLFVLSLTDRRIICLITLTFRIKRLHGKKGGIQKQFTITREPS